MSKRFIFVCLLVSGLAGLFFSIYTHKETANDVVPVRQTFHQPALFVKQLTGDADAGRKIYKEFCAACHDKNPAIDVNAPSLGDKKAWQARRKLGMKMLLPATINGIGAMPARGGCFECSDEQLSLAIHYILSK